MSIEGIVKNGATKAVSFLEKSIINFRPRRGEWKKDALKGVAAAALGVFLNYKGGTVGDIASALPWAYAAIKTYHVHKNMGRTPLRGVKRKLNDIVLKNYGEYRANHNTWRANAGKAIIVAGGAVLLNIYGGGISDIASVLPWIYSGTKAYHAVADLKK